MPGWKKNIPICLQAEEQERASQPLPCGPNVRSVRSGMRRPLAGSVSFDLLLTAPRGP